VPVKASNCQAWLTMRGDSKYSASDCRYSHKPAFKKKYGDNNGQAKESAETAEQIEKAAKQLTFQNPPHIAEPKTKIAKK